MNLAIRGEDFLEYKRELLILQIKKIWPEYYEFRKRFFKLYKKALILLNQTYKEMGKREFNLISRISKIQFKTLINIKYIKSKGTILPQIDYNLIQEEQLPAYSFENTSHYLDDLIVVLKKFFKYLIKFAENESILQRIATDYKNINRRINGLKNNIIPKLSIDLKIMKEMLEESERENYIRLKKTKDLIIKKREIF